MWRGSIPGSCGYTERMQREILRKNVTVTPRKQLKET
jgi:hypothetical protein